MKTKKKTDAPLTPIVAFADHRGRIVAVELWTLAGPTQEAGTRLFLTEEVARGAHGARDAWPTRTIVQVPPAVQMGLPIERPRKRRTP